MKKSKLLLILLPLIFIALIVVTFLFTSNSCKKRETQMVPSPDNRYLVNTNDMNCHATVPYIGDVVLYKVSIIKLPWISYRSVFGFNGTIDDVLAEWVDENTLKITYKNCKEIYGQDYSWKDINIVYENRCGETTTP